jgi:YD repeat-containing protein
LPDGQTVTTTFAGATSTVGATITVTDQVGRQRKSEADGLGRLVKVTEPDTATGLLSWETTYSYDALDNLKQTNQGGQIRSFSYDALSRLTSQTTPEGGTVNFFYWDFGAIRKKSDSRNVETHYKYDSLNRISQIWYTGLNGSDDPNAARQPLPTGVAATADVITVFNNFATAQVGNGQISQITDGSGSES